jgi:ribosome-associated toxin RatA of RatAB toxin-antitoxin module
VCRIISGRKCSQSPLNPEIRALMPEIHRFALVAYSPRQMYDLVCDVARYPEFLPWVRSAAVHEQDDQRQLATLEVRIAGITQRFTTENSLVPVQSLGMRLARGPFDELSGMWRFRALGETGCRVSLDLGFSLPGSLLMKPFRRGFEKMADNMVDDFCRRAEQIHG